MSAVLERPVRAIPTHSNERGDLRNGLLKLTRHIPVGHELTIVEVCDHEIIKPYFLSKSPDEIACRMETRPSSDFICSTKLATRGCPESIHWGICFESTITHYSIEKHLAVRQARILWTVEDTVRQFGCGYRPFHIRQGNRIYSLFFRDGLTKAFQSIAAMEVDGLSTIVEKAMQLAFPTESNLDDWLRYQFEGGDPPVDSICVNVVRVAGFPLPRRSTDYDVQIDTLLSETMEVAA